MSVTFHPELVATGRFVFECPEDGTATVRDSREEIDAARVVHMSVCDECNVYGCHTSCEWDSTVEVNMANGNAMDVLAALGLDINEMWGTIDPQDLSARIVLARAADDNEMATVRVGNWIECGREAGYIAGRLAEIQKVADEAARLGRQVVWG